MLEDGENNIEEINQTPEEAENAQDEIAQMLEEGDDEYNKKLSKDSKVIEINRSKEYRRNQRISNEDLEPRKSNKKKDKSKDKSNEREDEDPRS